MQYVHTHTHVTHVSILPTSTMMDMMQFVDLIDSMACFHLHMYAHGLFQPVRYTNYSAAFLTPSTPPTPPFPSIFFILPCVEIRAKSNF